MARPGISMKNTEKIAPRPKIWNPKKIPPKYRKNTKNGHVWYFGGIFSVFSGYFQGKFWESRISGRGLFFRYFSWKFRVGPSRGSVAGGGVLNSRRSEGEESNSQKLFRLKKLWLSFRFQKKGVFGKGSFRNLCTELCFVCFSVF